MSKKGYRGFSNRREKIEEGKEPVVDESSIRHDLINPELFGNEAGDDEELEVLDSYYLDKPEFDRFYSPNSRLAFVRSRKGVGKSALLKQTLFRRKKLGDGDILIYVKASDLIAMQDVKGSSPDELLYGWQQRICSQINLELGASLKVGFTDDSMMLIESAELAGFRNRNIVSALFDRMKVKGLGTELDRNRIGMSDPHALLRRVMDKKDITVWLFIDDVDATFVNTEHERLKASTFFSACRNIISSVKGLCIRASVRSDVWSVLAQHDEAMDKCEQYMLDLTWSTAETGRIIVNKIHSYFNRYYSGDSRYASLSPIRDEGVIRKIVFKEPFYWGPRKVESFRPVHILSAGRPRWAAQLCKLAGKDAYDKSTSRISIGHVRSVMRDYGQFRVSDLYKEHRHQCPVLQDIVESFSGASYRFTTDELLEHISDKIIKRVGVPKIDGVSSDKGGLSVAHFLFRCGFIAARDESDVTGLGFMRYEERPNLLSSGVNLDDGLNWEIHPSYREVLRVKQKAGEATHF
ncbi:hypothetical protein HX867_02290 [Pseudomonas gingeri]|uniref:P-loop ATPase, Sll1717 family n=1 Tax=Pseudomonas gingeri TaxID=117681 RepID=UPI0015A454A6|nr:hypothetical protein [Pseudomonas gingeri]NVZ60903.1 hypothetical protein [Pseudomonas gingeri]NVZ78445.1 hypothetical protein [Pseudomonas gingeri]